MIQIIRGRPQRTSADQSASSESLSFCHQSRIDFDLFRDTQILTHTHKNRHTFTHTLTHTMHIMHNAYNAYYAHIYIHIHCASVEEERKKKSLRLVFKLLHPQYDCSQPRHHIRSLVLLGIDSRRPDELASRARKD